MAFRPVRDFSVYSVWIIGAKTATYAKIKPLERAIAVGRKVMFQRQGHDTWQHGWIAEPPEERKGLGGGTIWITTTEPTP